MALALSGCAWLDSQQRRLALRPTPSQAGDAAVLVAALQPEDRRYFLTAQGDRGTTEQLAVWWLPKPDPAAPTLLYLHGTFRNLSGNLPKINALREAGFAILAVDYRGWGDSTPIIPSEASIHADAALAWAELQRLQPEGRKRVIFGHSMGTAVAVHLASQQRGGADYGALVLESAFTRMPDVAAAAGGWGRVAAWITTLGFDSLSHIGRVDGPILMLHGSADHTVPVELGRRLRDAAPAGVQWVEIPGGSHSRLHSDARAVYQQSMSELIARLTTAAAPTRP
jgi:uncharacterized protein